MHVVRQGQNTNYYKTGVYFYLKKNKMETDIPFNEGKKVPEVYL